MKRFLNLSFWFIFLVSNASAWDTDTVHPFITSNALTKANDLDIFLADFGLTNESFDSQDRTDGGSKSAKEWIALSKGH